MPILGERLVVFYSLGGDDPLAVVFHGFSESLTILNIGSACPVPIVELLKILKRDQVYVGRNSIFKSIFVIEVPDGWANAFNWRVFVMQRRQEHVCRVRTQDFRDICLWEAVLRNYLREKMVLTELEEVVFG